MSNSIPPSISGFSGKSVVSLSDEESADIVGGPADTFSQARGRFFGINVPTYDAQVVARAAFSRGDVVMFDLGWSDAATTGYSLAGLPTSGFTNVVAPTSGGIAAGNPIGVCLHDVADDSLLTVRVRGIATAFVKKSSGTSPVRTGDALCVATTKDFEAIFPTAGIYMALAWGTIGTGAMGTRSMLSVLLPGRNMGSFMPSTIGGGSGAYASAGDGGGGTGA